MYCDLHLQYSVCIGSCNARLHNIVGCFMIKAPWLVIFGRSKVKVLLESGTLPKFNQPFLGLLLTFLENFILLTNSSCHINPTLGGLKREKIWLREGFQTYSDHVSVDGVLMDRINMVSSGHYGFIYCWGCALCIKVLSCSVSATESLSW